MDGARVGGIDALKGAAIVGVVTLHVLATGTGRITQGWLEWTLVVVAGVCKISVPVFVAVTAYLACGRPPRPGAARRRLGAVVAVYVIWTAAYVALAHAVGGAALVRLHRTPAAEVVLLGGAWYHLYYLAVLPQLLLVMPVVRRIASSADRASIFLAVSLPVLALGSVTDGTGPLGQVLHRQWVLVWLPAAVVGAAFASGALRVRARSWTAAGLAIVVIEAVVAQHLHSPIVTTYARVGLPIVVGGALAAAVAWRGTPWLAELGRRSLGVYVLHPALLAVAGVVRHDRPYAFWTLPLVIAAVTLAAWGLTLALERTPLRRLVDLTARRPAQPAATLAA